MKVKHNAEIYIDQYPFHNLLVGEIDPLMKNFSDKQDKKTNVKASMSDWHISTPQIERLKKYIINIIDNSFLTAESISGGGKVSGNHTYQAAFKEFWINLYNKNDYTRVHHHSPAALSLVYFFKSKWYHSPLCFSLGGKVRPKEGRFVIFPSYLEHYVPKHRYNDTRITFSGNVFWKDFIKDSWLNITLTHLI